MYAEPGAPPRQLYGYAGFTKSYIELFLQGCPIRADQLPRQPAERPPPVPIIVDRPFQQEQVGSLGGCSALLLPDNVCVVTV